MQFETRSNRRQGVPANPFSHNNWGPLTAVAVCVERGSWSAPEARSINSFNFPPTCA